MRFPALLLLSPLTRASAQTPNADDIVWEKAVQQFDATRAAILRHLDEGGRTGLFHPNWESLKRYQIPACYRDAKFGAVDVGPWRNLKILIPA
jgi:alpha-L-fucosidase